MKKYTQTIEQIIVKINNLHAQIIDDDPFTDDENREEAFNELAIAVCSVEELCQILDRDEACAEAKNQMTLNL
jgi:hypothetical protein|tara:strand:+ start:312 stop:530 length:219 start_codon:yes stop_codon:yes gene_type:complete